MRETIQKYEMRKKDEKTSLNKWKIKEKEVRKESKRKRKERERRECDWLVYLEMISNVLTIVLKILENSIWINSSQRIEIILKN